MYTHLTTENNWFIFKCNRLSVIDFALQCTCNGSYLDNLLSIVGFFNCACYARKFYYQNNSLL